MALIQLNCPNCTGRVEVDDSLKFATCVHCKSQFLIDLPNNAPPPPPPPPAPPPFSSAPFVPHHVPPTPSPVKKSNATGCILFAVIVFVFLSIGFFTMIFEALDDIADNFPPTSGDNGPVNPPPPVNNNNDDDRIITADEFIVAAQKMGYFMIIEEDYDGFNTYWAGAHLFAEGVEQVEGNHIYVIDYTKDTTERNAKVEYILYVKEVKEFGGKENSGSGSNYEFQVNSSEEGFGIAYRVGDVNLFVTAPAEYKDEIMAFFVAIGFGVEV